MTTTVTGYDSAFPKLVPQGRGRALYNAHAPISCAQQALFGSGLQREGEFKRRAGGIHQLTRMGSSTAAKAAALMPPPGFEKEVGTRDIEEMIRKGACEEAIKLLDIQIRSSDDPMLLVLRANAQLKMAVRKAFSLKNALDDLTAVISKGDQVPDVVRKEAFIARGNIHYLLQHFDLAAEDYAVVVNEFKNATLSKSLIKSLFHARKFQDASDVERIFRNRNPEMQCYMLAIEALLNPKFDQAESKLFADLPMDSSSSITKLSHGLRALVLLLKQAPNAGDAFDKFKHFGRVEPQKALIELIKDFPPAMLVESVLDILEGQSGKIPKRYQRLATLGSDIGEIYARIADEVLRIIVAKEYGEPARIARSKEIKCLIQFLTQVEGPETFFCLAEIYQHMDQPHDAIKYCKKALALNPDHDFSHRMLAEIHFELGEFEEALPHCEAVCADDLTDPFTIYLYAIHMALGNRDKVPEAHKEIASMSSEVAIALLKNFDKLFKYGDPKQMAGQVPHFKHIQAAFELVEAQA